MASWCKTAFADLYSHAHNEYMYVKLVSRHLAKSGRTLQLSNIPKHSILPTNLGLICIITIFPRGRNIHADKHTTQQIFQGWHFKKDSTNRKRLFERIVKFLNNGGKVSLLRSKYIHPLLDATHQYFEYLTYCCCFKILPNYPFMIKFTANY